MKKSIMLAAAMLLLPWMIFGTGKAEAKAAKAVKIDAKEARSMLEKGGYILVDVRTSEEYKTGHIPGAILIPNESIIDKKPSLLPDLDASIIVYCRSGRRSADAAAKLLKIGYKNIYDLGGIIDWPYETTV
ncbi:MAG: rhodanese-like domain-containing protein [Sphaerochaetaceae bacterium]|jgi:phage shock protein E|nr:rhodanese-like domain-containing protein [Sphaerochaetaceae bacterium]